jgi:hypothetical protein
MNRTACWRAAGLVALAGLLLTASGTAQTSRPPGTLPAPRPAPATPKFVPKFEALAETRLIMEGLAHSNYRSLNKLLKERPADNDTWVFARGQALLLAETGNLLLLRPPRNSGRDTWMKLGMGLRSAAGTVARHAGNRDYPGAKAALAELTNACNRCHQTFRIPVKVAPDVAAPPPPPPPPAKPDAAARLTARTGG